jgi:ABC-2 type transport system ATP-binding protein
MTLALDVRGLQKTFGDVRAIDGLDLRVDIGHVHGLVGPNGAGKTTLLRVVFGLVAPDAGEVTVLGTAIDEAGEGSADGVGGFVEEPRFYPYLTARRNLELMADLDGGGGGERIDDVLSTVRLDDRAGRKVGGFSSGMRQRLGLAASLLRSPRLLLLDEPTVGLDPSGARDMLAIVQTLAADGVTVVVSSHNMSELEGVCDGVTVMREGRAVWHGSMERLRAESPAPAHRLETSDDARASEIAREDRRLEIVADPGGWLTVSADRDVLDAYVVALGTAGIAIRRLELLMTALESMLFSLPGERAEAATPEREPDELSTGSAR